MPWKVEFVLEQNNTVYVLNKPIGNFAALRRGMGLVFINRFILKWFELSVKIIINKIV